MKKSQLLILGLILLFLGPTYQGLDALLRNTGGDGVIVYGKYTLYRPFIGYKVEHYDWSYVDGWKKNHTVFYAPAWMKLLGVNEKVTYSRSEEKGESTFVQRTWSFLLRWGVKFFIPGIFFFLYFRKKENMEEKGYDDLFEV